MSSTGTQDEGVGDQPTNSMDSSTNSSMAGVELPSLEDRKCFLTCLACLLISSYKYDVKEVQPEKEVDNIETEATSADATAATGDATADITNTEPGGEDAAEPKKKPVRRWNSGGSEEDEDNMVDIPGSKLEIISMFLDDYEEEVMGMDVSMDISMEGDDENGSNGSNDNNNSNGDDDILDEYDAMEITASKRAKDNKKTESGNNKPRWRRPFGRGKNKGKDKSDDKSDKDKSTASNNTAVSSDDFPSALDDSDDKDNNNNNKVRKNGKNSKSVTASERKQRRKRISKAQKKLQLASDRHYHRRFVVADQLLQASCDHLLLDPAESGPLYEQLAPRLEVLKSPRVVIVAPPGAVDPTATTAAATETSTNNGTPTPTATTTKGGRIRKRWSNRGNGNKSSNSLTSDNMENDDSVNSGSERIGDADADANNDENGSETEVADVSEEKEDNSEENDDHQDEASPPNDGTTDDAANGDANNSDKEQKKEKKAKRDKELQKEEKIKSRARQLQQQYLTKKEWMTEYDEDLADHLPNLNPGAGYRCVCWLLFQHLINANKRGYDARVRYIFKSLAVAVLVQDIERTIGFHDETMSYAEWKTKNYTTWVSFATRKFDQVEAGMSDRLLKLAQQATAAAAAAGGGNDSSHSHGKSNTDEDTAVNLEDLEAEDEDEIQIVTVNKNKKKLVGARKHLVRGLKIGGVGVVAGTLLAVTGGMAAPAIAGALTFLGMGAVAGTFLTLASTTAVVHLFGVAGGGLAAYKMRRRTAGLTEFTIVQSAASVARQSVEPSESELDDDDLLPGEKEQAKANRPRLAKWRDKAKTFKDRRMNKNGAQDDKDAPPKNAELSRTICISGWLTDKCDFQRPWGITPSKPAGTKLERLQRFYRVYNPDLIPISENLLKRWKKEETTFYDLLEDKYGCNPDTLFPLQFGPMHDAILTGTELSVLDKLIVEVGEAKGRQKEAQHAHLPAHVQGAIASNPNDRRSALQQTDSTRTLGVGDEDSIVTSDEGANAEEQLPQRYQRQCYASVFEQVAPSASLSKLIQPSYLLTVWDYSSRYGGEVYSLHWETHMLLKLSLCFRDVALTTAASAGQQALKLMVANTIALAASVPIYVMQAMNSIDETWSVVVSRAEDAGKELARSLLINNAGHRPVTLIGYSFGARVVFECLKQLAVYQQQWEDYHEQKASHAMGFADVDDTTNKSKRKEKKWRLHELEFDREPASVVEDAIVIGAPMYLSLSSWKACRQVVAGRFVNVYSRTDKILSLMFKYKQMMESFKPVCGNCTIAMPGVENIDVSDLVANHQEYVLKMGDILKRVRHEQPIRSSTNALDEIALIAEANQLVHQQTRDEILLVAGLGESSSSAATPPTEVQHESK